MIEKVDFKKALKQFYNPGKGRFHLVTVPVMNFLMMDGMGDPNFAPEYQRAVETLYTLSYGIKFALKRMGFDYVVPPLEGLWWMEDMSQFTVENKYRWEWTMMIMQPDKVNSELVETVKRDVWKKKKLSAVDNVRFDRYDEGLAVQVLYTGAYADEAPTIAEMHRFIRENGYVPNGKHHEIYLGDQRKVSPDKLQTVLRQPIRKA